ncbi:MAG: radical SAM protein [Thermodesulfovibrionia bacterium]|nr:radical SAM protein [Thermodesulfovibrionia bacterium]MCK5511252.1 radical SAM protein [Thermodesulfovibrionia bacterium]
MKQTCILINPWIYDFAAVNLWSRPLGLLKVAEYMSRFDLDLKLIDCTDVQNARRSRKYGTGKYPRQVVEKPGIVKDIPRHFARYGISLENFRERFTNHLPCDFVLITSVMCYWYPGVQKVIELIRSISPRIPIILGGIYATLYHKHASENSCADFVYRGHIGDNIKTVLRTFGYRLKEKETPRPYYKLGMYKQPLFAPIITSTGCPYRCSYCASSILFDGFSQKDPLDVINEIKDCYTIGIRDYAFYDDALLVNTDSYLKVVLKEVITSKLTVRFHCPNGLHAQFIDDELVHLMKEAGFTTLRLGLETVNGERQVKTGDKVTTDILVSAVKNLKKHGFTKDHIGVYLMYGLPGQELKEVREGVEFLKSIGVRINLTEFSPIPGTACWEELKNNAVINDSIDPLLTNNTVFTYLYSGYDRKALENLKLDVKQHNNS